MNVKVYGAKAFWCQVPRIIDGLRGLGCQVVESGPYMPLDFIYANNPPYDKGDEEHKDCPLDHKDTFKIFNVLDISRNQTEQDVKKLKNQLLQADTVTCISHVTKQQLKDIGIISTVIWNPIKDVFADHTIGKANKEFLYVGRAADPNKRFGLLRKLNDVEPITVVGNERPSFSNYIGPQSDTNLHVHYNTHKFVLLPSEFEGLGLPMLEAMAAGSIPLVCSDNKNSELCPSICVVEPSEKALLERYHFINKDYNEWRDFILNKYTNKIQFQFSKFSIAQNIMDVYNRFGYERF